MYFDYIWRCAVCQSFEFLYSDMVGEVGRNRSFAFLRMTHNTSSAITGWHGQMAEDATEIIHVPAAAQGVILPPDVIRVALVVQVRPAFFRSKILRTTSTE